MTDHRWRQAGISRRDRGIARRHGEQRHGRRRIAHSTTLPAGKFFSGGGGAGGQGQYGTGPKTSPAAAIADGERVSIGCIGTPEPEALALGQRGIGGRGTTQLINGINAVTIRARAHFAGAEVEPVTLFDDAVVIIGTRKLPGYRAAGRQEGRQAGRQADRQTDGWTDWWAEL